MNISDNVTYMSSLESVERMYQFLGSHPVGVISTVKPDGRPHAAVIYFTINTEFEILFVTKTSTQKYLNIQNDPNAVLVCFDNFSQTTVQVTGIISEEMDGELRKVMLATLDRLSEAGAQSHTPPITKLDAGDYVVLRLNPTMIRMAIFMRPESGGYDIFETVKFKYPKDARPHSLVNSQA